MDVSAWLKSLDLVECALVFKDNAIGVDVIADLTAEDLREIGVSAVGHRRKTKGVGRLVARCLENMLSRQPLTMRQLIQDTHQCRAFEGVPY